LGVASEYREARLPAQPKTGRGTEQSSVEYLQREALDTYHTSDPRVAAALDVPSVDKLDDYSIRQFIEFFTILDRWDREAHGNETM
jgi:hypothetical protein